MENEGHLRPVELAPDAKLAERAAAVIRQADFLAKAVVELAAELREVVRPDDAARMDHLAQTLLDWRAAAQSFLRGDTLPKL